MKISISLLCTTTCLFLSLNNCVAAVISPPYSLPQDKPNIADSSNTKTSVNSDPKGVDGRDNLDMKQISNSSNYESSSHALTTTSRSKESSLFHARETMKTRAKTVANSPPPNEDMPLHNITALEISHSVVTERPADVMEKSSTSSLAQTSQSEKNSVGSSSGLNEQHPTFPVVTDNNKLIDGGVPHVRSKSDSKLGTQTGSGFVDTEPKLKNPEHNSDHGHMLKYEVSLVSKNLRDSISQAEQNEAEKSSSAIKKAMSVQKSTERSDAVQEYKHFEEHEGLNFEKKSKNEDSKTLQAETMKRIVNTAVPMSHVWGLKYLSAMPSIPGEYILVAVFVLLLLIMLLWKRCWYVICTACGTRRRYDDTSGSRRHKIPYKPL